ncbi:very short patch repair endonuclease [Streptosporangium sp. NPDC000095]|uniref:very short patch repair endonuclease n=1 Tax=Streptosporangium sp. NPDC000095 TaxID=3366184 RepID=UPI0036C0A03D
MTKVPEAPQRASGRWPTPLNEARSRNMRSIRAKDTKPEVTLRRELHRLGYRYRKHLRLQLGEVRIRPDIVFTARRIAVFVDGCFWHVCPTHGRQPVNNDWYWTPKLKRNIERDRQADEALVAHGWRVIRIWEHEDLSDATERIGAAVAASTRRAQTR